MGTFHDNLGELHGITVVVDTVNDQQIVGRCHEASDVHVIMHDADVNDPADSGVSRDEYLTRAAKWGVFPKHKTLRIAREHVTTITRLNELDLTA
ncbi:MAG: hypothetical protein GC159_14490 [Phycisphaera sp.]|nr:hypothetical protein [Phycisphaera sp.]